MQEGRIRVPWGDERTRHKFDALLRELLEIEATRDCRMALWFPKWHYKGLVSLHLNKMRPPQTDPRFIPPPPQAPPPRLLPVEVPRRQTVGSTQAMMRGAGLPW